MSRLERPEGSAMNVEGLWSINFVSNTSNYGAGIIVFEDGHIRGGDQTYFYLGTYSLEARELRAKVKVTHYAGEPHSIFGTLSDFDVNLIGEPSDSQMELVGYLAERPDAQLVVHLTKRGELDGTIAQIGP
jgi:hypothetical protein